MDMKKVLLSRPFITSIEKISPETAIPGYSVSGLRKWRIFRDFDAYFRSPEHIC